MKNILTLGIILTMSLLFASKLDLTEAWQLLLSESSEVKSENLNLKSAETDVLLAWRQMFPSAGLSGSFRTSLEEFDEANSSLSASISQPIFDGGKNYMNLQSAKKSLQIAENEYKTLLLNMRSQLEEKYLAVLQQQEKLEIVRKEMEYINCNLKTARLRYDNGELAHSEFLQLRSQAAQQEVSILQAENNLRIVRSDLANLLSIEDEIELHDLDSEKYNKVFDVINSWNGETFEEIEQELFQYAVRHNPALQNSELNVAINEDNVLAAKGSFLPTLSLSIGKSWDYNDGDLDPEGSASFGINASIPVFSILENNWNYTKSKYSKMRADLDLKLSEQNLKLELRSILLNLFSSTQEINAAEIALEYAEESYRITEESYSNKIISANELLDSRIALITAENTLNTAMFDFLSYKSSLQETLGILEEEELWEVLFVDLES